jgi:hypothetical protein
VDWMYGMKEAARLAPISRLQVLPQTGMPVLS